MTTKTNKSLARFLDTEHGHLAVCSYIGVRAHDIAQVLQASNNAEHYCPANRKWTLADLRDAALRIDTSGRFVAKEADR